MERVFEMALIYCERTDARDSLLVGLCGMCSRLLNLWLDISPLGLVNKE